MQSQSALIDELRATDNESWLITLDAGRADIFEDLHDDYLTGEYQRAHNGGKQNTPHWFEHHFDDDVHGMLFHGGQPIHSIRNARYDYNERNHFRHVPYHTLYETGINTPCPPDEVNKVVRMHNQESRVESRLEALGYRPRSCDESWNLNVVRYLQPHKPFHKSDGLGIQEAYRENYEYGLEHALALVNDLEGDIVITSDHGECLGECGQTWHGPQLSEHDHLVEVPWLKLS